MSVAKLIASRLRRTEDGLVQFDLSEFRKTLGDPLALALITTKIRPIVLPDVQAIGGPALGAVPLAISVSLVNLTQAIRWFCIRNAGNVHPVKLYIRGDLRTGDNVCLVDDIVTTGRTLQAAAHRCAIRGARIRQVITLVDRERGGLAFLRSELGPDVTVQALCTLSEIHAHAETVRNG